MKPYNYKVNSTSRSFYFITATLHSFCYIIILYTVLFDPAMRTLKGLLFSLALLFVTPGGMEPTPPTPTGGKRRRLAAQCTECGFVTHTVDGLEGHVCGCHPKVIFWSHFWSQSSLLNFIFLFPQNLNISIDWRTICLCDFCQNFIFGKVFIFCFF